MRRDLREAGWLLAAVAALAVSACSCPGRDRAGVDAGAPGTLRVCLHPGEQGACEPAEALDFGLVGDVAPAERALRVENTGVRAISLRSAVLSSEAEGFDLLDEALRPFEAPRPIGPGAALVVVVRVPPRSVAGPLPRTTLTLAFGNAEPAEVKLAVLGAWSGCPEGFAACVPGGACETDVHGDVRNCGGCGVACSLANVNAACAKGRCVPAGACFAGFGNCDGKGANGCETPTTTVENCGGCANASPLFSCARPQAHARCVDGGCLQACVAGRADCDGDLADPAGSGCEVELASSLEHCGACGAACAPANASGVCAEGACGIAACDEGFADCDRAVGTGCEVTLADDAAHCGACGNDCAARIPNAEVRCFDGACAFVACREGFVDLDGEHEPDGDGCEYACVAEPGPDLPDDAFADSNCDGIDGTASDAVFVRADGADRDDGRSPATAVATLERALQVAVAARRSLVLVAEGAYVNPRTLTVPDGVSLHGGYANDFRSRSAATTRIAGPAAGVLRWDGLTRAATLERIDISAADAATPGAPAVALHVADTGPHLSLRFLAVTAGSGGPAVDTASDGGQGAPAGSSVGLVIERGQLTLVQVTIRTGTGGRSIGAVLDARSSLAGGASWLIGEAEIRCATEDESGCHPP